MKFLLTDNPANLALCQYRIDSERKLRIDDYCGLVGLDEVKSITTSAASDPCWTSDLNGLLDFSRAELSMSANDVLRWALSLRQAEYLTKGWLVFVVPNSMTYGLIRMLGQWSRNTGRFRIFFDRSKAEAWLERHGVHTPPGFAAALQASEDDALRHVV